MELGRQNTAIRLAVALAAIVAALVCMFVITTPQAQAKQAYAQLSGKYESGNDPACIDPGVAYGAYQMSADNALLFAKSLQKQTDATYKSWGDALVTAHAADGNKCGKKFDTAWKNAAAQNRSAFLTLQYRYCKENYYAAAVKYWKKVAPGFKTGDYTYALRNVIFSCAVANGPYGSAYNILKPALVSAGGWHVGLDEADLINAIYDEWSRVVDKPPRADAVQITSASKVAVQYGLVGKYLAHYYSSPSNVQASIYRRLSVNERADALNLLQKYLMEAGECKHVKTVGGQALRYYNITDKKHTEDYAATTCTTCGKVVEPAGTRTVKNVYVRKGASYKDASGHPYTVHRAKDYYKVNTDNLNLRTKASSKSKIKGIVTQNKIVKVTKAKMGSDGFWWGKVKVNGSKGWIQMQFLAHLGTGNTHSFKNGKCKYCGLNINKYYDMNSIKIATKGKKSQAYQLTTKTKAYKNAYKIKKEIKKTLKKGKTYTITSVVKNQYNDWWAKVKGIGYVKLENFV